MNWITTGIGTHYTGGYPFWDSGAGGKARFDIETTLLRMDFQSIPLFANVSTDLDPNYLVPMIHGTMTGIKRGDNVFIQYPLSNRNSLVNELITRCREYEANIISIVHDIDYWREKPEAEFEEDLAFAKDRYYYENMKQLAESDGIIVHSKAMQQRLQREFETLNLKHDQKYAVQGLFGFLSLRMTNAWHRELKENIDIDYAGALSKARFLTQLPSDIKVNIFGSSNDELIKAQGPYDHQAIPHLLKGNFGLVWDSDTYPGITGVMGEYEKYNSPFKASMYLAADQPIIVAKQSALAPFVTAQNIGFAIESLDEIQTVFEQLTKEKYDEMIDNTHRIGELIRTMYPIKHAVLEIIDKINWNI